MHGRSGRQPRRSGTPWASIARLGHMHWFFGNLYEALVDVPHLLTDAQPKREPRLLGAGSPLRYYLPFAPLTLIATVAALIDKWRSGGDRGMIALASTSTAFAAGLTAYLVRGVNLRLLQNPKPLAPNESRRLVTTWQRVNSVRLILLVVAVWALRHVGERSRPPT